jgi:hypothetical protein
MELSAKERSNSTDLKKIVLTWPDYLTMNYKLIDILKSKDLKIEAIYGIPRGGLIPAVMLSHELNVPIIYKFFGFECNFYSKILVIDDICDTGKSLKEHAYIPNKIITATLFKHIKSSFTPDYYIETNDCWISFPYEKE